MIAFRFTKAGVVVALALMASGCGTPREKTAPCKRPANLSSYAQSIIPCGPMAQLNADRAAALAAIEQLPEAGNE